MKICLLKNDDGGGGGGSWKAVVWVSATKSKPSNCAIACRFLRSRSLFFFYFISFEGGLHNFFEGYLNYFILRCVRCPKFFLPLVMVMRSYTLISRFHRSHFLFSETKLLAFIFYFHGCFFLWLSLLLRLSVLLSAWRWSLRTLTVVLISTRNEKKLSTFLFCFSVHQFQTFIHLVLRSLKMKRIVFQLLL